MKRLPRNAKVTNLTIAEHNILKICMSKYCLYNMEDCPCNSRSDSSRYCEYYSQMVKVYAKIRQPELFMSIDKVA